MPSGRPHESDTPARRRRIWIGSLAGALLLIGAGVWLFDVRRHEPRRSPTQPTPSIPGGELWDARSTRVFDTDTPFGSGRVPPAQFAWPVKPFDSPHVLRATFGEPRGLLDAGLGIQGADRAMLLGAANQLAPIGRRVIHTGVDIIAADGTPVYAVESGIARTGGATWDQYVLVGRFGYWHLANPVTSGTHVTAFSTVIGTVYPGQGHVHLTRFATPGGPPVNPLIAGGIQPYTDTAPPEIGPVVAFDRRGRNVALDALKGPVVLAVRAADIQSNGATRTGLYGLRYSVVPAGGGKPVVVPTDTFRFDVVPSQAGGDIAYTLGSTRHRFETNFWYRISDRSPSGDGFLHTERHPPGRYDIVVTASDARGNQTRRRFPVTVAGP